MCVVYIKKTLKNVAIIQADGTKKLETILQIPKSKGSVRDVPINEKIIPMLKKHGLQQKEEKLKTGDAYTDNDFVFTTRLGLSINACNLLRAYKRVLTKANIPYKKFHALRHTFATKLFEKSHL